MRNKLLLAAAVLAAAVCSPADDWPQFRGPNRDGKSAETGLLKQWPEGGPKLLWSHDDVGQGFTHVTVAKGLIYVTGMVDKEGILRAYAPDGTLRWKVSYGGEWFKSHPGARSIPTVHDGLVYVASGIGNVGCYDAATGRQVWYVKLFERYDAPEVKWGYAESALIDGDRVIFTPCGKKATMVALDRKTGEQVWASPDLKQTSSFCSPALVTQRGIRMIVTLLDSSVVAFSPDDGKLLWQHAYRNFRGNHCNTPIYHEGMLYVTSGYRKGAIGLKIADDGRSVKQLWEQDRQDPCHGHAVLVDGYVYAASHQTSGKWSCVELATGKLMWEDACIGRSGSVVYADGMLYGYSEDGNVGLIRPNPERCEVVSRFKVPMGDGNHWAHPTVANGRLYIRHGNALMCYDVAADKP
ncbi:MAG TPA: PQQ-binding-like beta-propeller repeat protein [Planctomycetota bacterium]|nr:PQQ-binding-like beta-propeller repeat protein [Planctomycetota bacterium]